MSDFVTMTAAAEETFPSGGLENVLGDPLVVEAAPAVLLSWSATIRSTFFSTPSTCALRDVLTGTIYAPQTVTLQSTPTTYSATVYANLASDATFELYCTRTFWDTDPIYASDVSVVALTFAV